MRPPPATFALCRQHGGRIDEPDPRHRRRQQPDEVGARRAARVDHRQGITPNTEIGTLVAARLAEPAAAVARRRRQRRRRGGARSRRGPACALATRARVADGDRRRMRRHQPLRSARAARRRPLGVARRRAAAVRLATRPFPARMRRRQRGHGGHDRRARRRRRVPRRPDPARNPADAAGARREHGRAQGGARRISRFPDNTADALYSGAMQAVCGAIEQMRRQIDTNRRAGAHATSRAARPPRSRRTSIAPVEVVDNLVLEGVLALAGEAG